MTQAVEKINDIERKVKGKIIIAPLENEIKQRFIQVSKNAKIQGFRPGKAPMSIIEKQYGPDIRSEVYSRAIENQFGQIVQENKLNIWLLVISVSFRVYDSLIYKTEVYSLVII